MPDAALTGAAGQQRGLYGSRLLILPDGYVGATFDGADLARIDDYLARVLPYAGTEAGQRPGPE